MNERIRLLCSQAISDVDGIQNPDTQNMYIPDCFAEKFAELIVQECVGVTNAEMDDILDQSVFNPTDEIWNRARVEELVRVVQLIKKHFGVEE
jgi:hypothetical protein